jgi:transcriptional regulator with XRE-family HTH domain
MKEAIADDSYWVERAKLSFATSLETQRRKSGLSYKEVADKIRSSAAYISKVFRGDSNLTIESMVKLANATGGCLEVKVVSKESAIADWAPVISKSAHRPVISTSSDTITASAQNDNVYWIDQICRRAA